MRKASIIALFILWTVDSAATRDDGRHAQSDPATKEWFNSLKSKRGESCCAEADGVKLDDPQWRETADGYEVVTGGGWRKIPETAVLDIPNRVGFAMVWLWGGEIKCFIAGTRG